MNPRITSKLAIVEPAAETTILTSNGAPVVRGKGDMDLICGGCNHVLVQGETATEVALQYKVLQLVIKCSQCGRYNQISPETME